MKNEQELELIILPPKEKKKVTKNEIANTLAKLIFLLVSDD